MDLLKRCPRIAPAGQRGARKLALLAFVILPATYAQLYTGSVTGAITDPSGSVVPAAKITLVDEQKGFSFPAISDGTGRYLLRPIPPGSYTISVEAAGFRSERKEKIHVDVNQNLSIDFQLALATTSEAVEVTAAGGALATQDAVTGQVVNRTFINDLPLINRGVFDLTSLAPGVTEVDTQCPPSAGCPPTNFISNGSRNLTADVLLDGVTTTNFEQNSGIQTVTYTPSVDAVEEFKVQQSNFSAEFGFAGATVINVVTRSGSNEFHGSGYEFLRNQVLDANDWFGNKYGNAIPPLRRNNYGATFGGPIKKNKTFFFVDYEGLRQRSFSSATAGVPTKAMRTGDFSELCTLPRIDPNTGNPGPAGSFDANGICSNPAGQLWDPYSGSPDPNLVAVRSSPIPFNNLATYASQGNPALNGTPYQVRLPGVPGNLIDPVALKMMQLFPLPNLNGGTVDSLANNWFGSGVSRTNDDKYDIKVDHHFGDRDSLSARYSQEWGTSHSFECFGNGADPCNQGPIDNTAHLVAINHTHIFGPTLVLSASYGFTRGAANQPGISGDFSNLDPVQQLGEPAYMNAAGFKQFPSIILTGYNSPMGGTNLGTTPFTILREGQETHQLVGSLDWVRGKHELKFGGEGRMHRINFTNPGWPGGQFQFDYSGTAQNTATPTGAGGDALASFLIGVGTMSQPQPNACNCVYEVPNLVSTQSFRFSQFIQDNYKVTSKLTLNLGLRYELSLPRTERYNRMNWLDPNLSYSLQPGPNAPPGSQPIPVKGGEVFANAQDRNNYYTDYKDIQPRFGFAYQLPRSFVIRGGYGIYYSTPRSGASGTGPWGFQGYDQQTNWIPTFQNAGILPGATLSNPFPGAGPKLPLGSALGPLNDIGFDAVGPIRSISQNTPYEQAWSLGFQKELPWQVVVDATYAGKKGTHLYLGGFRQLNHLGPQVASLTTAQIQDLATTQVPNPFYGYINDPLSQLSGTTVAKYMAPSSDPSQAGLHLPFPQFTGFLGDSPPIADSIYHAMQIRVEKPFSNGLQFLITYTWSKSIDDASSTDDSVQFYGGGLPGGAVVLVQDPNNLRPERAVSTFDIPQLLQLSYVYDLPFGRGRRFGAHVNAFVNVLFGGWQTNGIWRFDNGRPILPYLQNSISIPTYGQRPELTGTLERASGRPQSATDPGTSYFANPNVLAQTPPYTLGNAPRTITSVRQPGTRNATLSLFKQFSLGSVREGMRLEYRLEAFNALNHPHFAGPDSAVGSPTFGQILSTASSSREVQMALKLYW
jgi:hypothetical protein